MKFPFVFVASLLFLSTLSVLGGSSKKKESIQEISRDAYVWGYPVVFLSHIRESMLAKTKESKNSLNHFFNSRKIPDSFLGSFLSVNPENVYSWAWVDLSKEPLVLIHPQIKDRFYSIQFVDAYANVFRTLSNHNQGEKPGAFLITPPGWHGPLPAAMGQILASTPEILIFSQTFLEGFNGRTSFSKLEFKPKLIPLSQWMAGVEIDSFRAEYPQARLKIDKNLATGGRKFYQELSRIVAKNPPPTKAETKEMERFNTIGLQSEKDFDQLISNPEIMKMLERGAFEGEREIQEHLASGNGIKVNGWSYELKSEPFTEDYLLRASTSQLDLFSSPPEESMRMTLNVDSEDRQLNSFYSYVLHFQKNELPPARKMWSIQVQETNNKNSKNLFQVRSFINDKTSSLKYNKDGSMDLYFQTEKPSPARRSNWLSLPEDANFYIILTLFNPHNSVLNHQYVAPSLIRQEDLPPPKQRFTQTMMAVSF